jgi:hypothetical protein
MAYKKTKTPLTIELLQTPQGQEALQAGGASLADNNLNFSLAFTRFLEKAKQNGMLPYLQIALAADIAIYGPPLILNIIQMLQNGTKKKKTIKK